MAPESQAPESQASESSWTPTDFPWTVWDSPDTVISDTDWDVLTDLLEDYKMVCASWLPIQDGIAVVSSTQYGAEFSQEVHELVYSMTVLSSRAESKENRSRSGLEQVHVEMKKIEEKYKELSTVARRFCVELLPSGESVQGYKRARTD